jgi:thiol:disulfide interchange protein DsbC
MKKFLVTSLLISGLSNAQQPSNEISDGFKQLAPDVKISSASKTPIKGIKQIKLDTDNIDDVFYITEDGKYLIQGNIIETKNRRNLTEDSKTDTRKDIVNKFDENQRIDFFPEDMKHHITVYTDIDCGYCRKLHTEMQDYNDLGIGISYLFWPRSGINTPSYNKAVSAWCAVDRNEAMTLAQSGMPLEPKQCDNPVAEHFESGKKIGVRGTPNIVTDAGELIPTYMPAKDLLQRLELLATK